jgi:coproporphyrinogen III oxidase
MLMGADRKREIHSHVRSVNFYDNLDYSDRLTLKQFNDTVSSTEVYVYCQKKVDHKRSVRIHTIRDRKLPIKRTKMYIDMNIVLARKTYVPSGVLRATSARKK